MLLGLDLGSTTVKYVLLDDDRKILARDYRRHKSDLILTVRTLLSELNERFSGRPVRPVLSGSGALALSEALGVTFLQEVAAGATFLADRLPDADVAIELGGEDAKLLYLTNGLELRMNEACAGGTGAFIDQMAALLSTDAAGLDELALSAAVSHPIASRCGVFAKTDLVALLNAGVPRSEAARSVFDAVAEQTISGLACGRPIRGKIVFLGGPLSFLKGLRESFIRKLEGPGQSFTALDDAHFAVAHAQMVVHDGEQRCEIGNRLVFGHVVVDAQPAADIDEPEIESEPFEVLDDDVDLQTHVFEDMQFADLRTDMQVHTDDIEVFERADTGGIVENLFVGDTELAVGLTGIDAMVGFGIDVGIDAQGHIDPPAGFGGEGVEDGQLLDRFAVDGHDSLFDGIAELLVAFPHTGIDDGAGIETRFDRLAYLVSGSTIDTQPVFADDRKQTVVVIGFYGIMDLIVVTLRFVDDAFERLTQQFRVIEIEGRFQIPEPRGDTFAQHNYIYLVFRHLSSFT